MRKTIIFIVSIYFFSFLAESELKASAFSIGDIQTVLSEGSFDVVRNPALIAIQKENNSIGIFIFYRPYSLFDLSASAYRDFFQDENLTSDKTGSIVGNANLAYCRKFGNKAFGIAVSTNNHNLINFYKEKKIFTGIDAMPSNISQEWDINAKYINPALIASLGIAISNKSSIGFQVISGYSIEINENNMDLYVNSIKQKEESTTRQSNTISSEFAIGYLRRNNDSQIGFIIKSGKLSFRKTTIDFDYSQSVPFAEFDGETETGYYFQLNTGPSLTAGGYIRLSPLFGITLEGSYILPAYYRMRDFAPNPTDQEYEQVKSRVTNHASICIRGGLEIYFVPSFTLSIGGGISFSSSNTDGQSDINIKNEPITATIGIDYNFSKGSRITVGAQMLKENLSIKQKNYPNTTSIYSDSIFLNTFIGMLFMF